MQSIRAAPHTIPLLVQLLENPRYHLPGVTQFHGAVDLAQHDCIHIILGRGLLEMDEAFTIGFTMGSTRQVSKAEIHLFAWIAQFWCPRLYRFSSDAIAVFRDAVAVGAKSGCLPLDSVDFSRYQNCRWRRFAAY
jgi:hypothetical protein